ncbi:MAG TPA: VOC family protein [Anaeromyxobacteraceae bacterium]|nr:VOC family protein [Anaeromyxobacteraceae bacterium]
MAQPSPVPPGAHTVTPSLALGDCARALEFYRLALGAEEVVRMPTPDGRKVWHAEIRIGDSIVYLGDEQPGMRTRAPSPDRPSPVGFWLYVVDCEAAYRRAVQAGALSAMPPTDMFWGDRTATVHDPFGYTWTFATHVKDLSPEEVERAGREFARKAGLGG